MKKLIVLGLLLALINCFGGIASIPSLLGSKHTTLPEGTPASWELSRSVARLTYDTPEGKLISTAFSVAWKYQVTAAHSCIAVMENAVKEHTEPVVKLEYTNVFDELVSADALVLFVHPEKDICILYSENDMLPLAVVPSRETPRLSKLYLLGAPLGHYPTLVDCYLSSHDSSEELHQSNVKSGGLALSCVGSPGYSGAPIINEQGQVVGVLTNAALIHPSLPLGTILFGTVSEDLIEVLSLHDII